MLNFCFWFLVFVHSDDSKRKQVKLVKLLHAGCKGHHMQGAQRRMQQFTIVLFVFCYLSAQR